jgi:broad specificity phosphatase PhoE
MTVTLSARLTRAPQGFNCAPHATTRAMESSAEIVLARHGETEWSSSGRHTSFTDVPLTDYGRQQARRLSARLAGREFASVLTSPRQRARETCELAGLMDRAEVSEDVAEWNYGDYEGRTIEEIRRDVPDWTIFSHGAPGGESADDVAARADGVIRWAMAYGDPVVVFSHGHFLRVLGARWIALPASGGALLGLDTATLSLLGHERDQRVLRVWNS